MSTDKNKQYSIKVTKPVYDKIDSMSKRLDMPKAQCLNMLVEQWLKANDRVGNGG